MTALVLAWWYWNLTKQTFFLDQHGCAKNQVDGELLISHLTNAGYVRTDDASNADLIIINSCGFIQSAKQESLDAVMNARAAYPHAKILLAGCLAERYADVFKTDLPEADGIFGNGDLSQIVQTARDVLAKKRPVVVPSQNGVCCGDRPQFLSFSGSAYVKITEGCNNCCSFCAIPLIRGSLRSRPVSEIVTEVKKLVSDGTREINLIGQDLAAYGCGKTDDVLGNGKNGLQNTETSLLHDLLVELSKIEGQFWIRLLYIHPDHFNADILSLMQKDKRILPYFDIPFQSGSDRIIKAMNRTGTFERYVSLIKTIRTALPDASIRTTFLTGFPGETEDGAHATEKFLEAIQPDWSGCFAYSREEDTPAYNFKGRVAKKTAELRAAQLEKIQTALTAQRLKQRVGQTYDVLVEEIIQNNDGTDDGLAIGRAWFEAPDVDGNVVIRYDLDDANAVSQIVPGNVVKVKAIASSELDIDGVYCAG